MFLNQLARVDQHAPLAQRLRAREARQRGQQPVREHGDRRVAQVLGRRRARVRLAGVATELRPRPVA